MEKASDRTESIDLRAATADDIAFIMATERLPGYEALVGRWEAQQHEAALADPRYAVLIGMDDGTPVGFAILDGWAAPTRVTLIKRLAVTEPGRGHGRPMLGRIADLVFGETEAYRLWIGCFPDNLRARHTYERAGFVPEGITRGSAFFHGISRDELILSMLRPEWQSKRGSYAVP